MPFRETKSTDASTANLGFGIDVTTQCNLGCITCYYLDSEDNRPVLCDSHISVASFSKAMQAAARAGFQEIYVLGGEPAIHPCILELLSCAAAHRFQQVLLVTNGIRLADRDFCQAVAATGAHLVVQRHVIGDGPHEQRIQDVVVGKKGTLALTNQAFANIEAFFEPGRVAVQCCITRPVVESGQLYSVFRYAKRRGFEHVMECSKASPRFPRGNPLDLAPAELLQVFAQLQKIDIEEFGGVAYPLTPQAYGKTCHMPETGVHCLVDGTIVPCVGQPLKLGNILAEDGLSLEEILHSPQRDFFRRPVERLQGHCRDCAHLAACTGGCRGDAYFLTGCFSASAIQCPQLALLTRPLGRSDFVPASCDRCALDAQALCGPKADADQVLARYLGAAYRRSPSA